MWGLAFKGAPLILRWVIAVEVARLGLSMNHPHSGKFEPRYLGCYRVP
jgi:hypothetical protein